MADVPSARTVRSVVAGAPVQTPDPSVLVSTNPADTRDVVARVELAGVDDFVRACRSARQAQLAWAAVPAPVRGRIVQQVGELVQANKAALAALITREMGKTTAESLGEVQEVIDSCIVFEGEGRRLYGQTIPSEMPDKQLFTFRRPVGVAAVVTAANFPAAVPSWYLVPALVCGNAVVWKPAEVTAAVGAALAELFWHGGVPREVLQVVQADGATTFKGLEEALSERLVDKVGFTGSTEVGQRLSELGGRFLVSSCLELGGKNPMVVAPDADVALAVDGALFGGFGTAGQRCTSLGTAIVHRSVHDEFVGTLDERLRASRLGDPTQDVLYGPMIAETYLHKFESFLDLVHPHHSVLGSDGTGRITSANPRRGFVGDPDAGWYAHPMIVDGVTAGDELYLRETFGPLVGVASYDDFDEAVALANGHGYGLSSAVYTRDQKTAFQFAARVSAGMTSVNNSTSGAEVHVPFGGNGLSGNGSRQGGIWVLDQFTRWQAVNWDFSGHLQKAQMDIMETPADLGFRLP